MAIDPTVRISFKFPDEKQKPIHSDTRLVITTPKTELFHRIGEAQHHRNMTVLKEVQKRTAEKPSVYEVFRNFLFITGIRLPQDKNPSDEELLKIKSNLDEKVFTKPQNVVLVGNQTFGDGAFIRDIQQKTTRDPQDYEIISWEAVSDEPPEVELEFDILDPIQSKENESMDVIPDIKPNLKRKPDRTVEDDSNKQFRHNEPESESTRTLKRKHEDDSKKDGFGELVLVGN